MRGNPHDPREDGKLRRQGRARVGAAMDRQAAEARERLDADGALSIADRELHAMRRERERKPRSNGLGRLAGGWSEAELREFERAVAPFEAIDDDLWR